MKPRASHGIRTAPVGVLTYEDTAKPGRGSSAPRGFTVIALPAKIGGGSGGPLRIVALLPPSP